MKFHTMDETGHSTIEFTADQKAEAERLFNELVGEKRQVAAVKTGSGESKLVREFDPTQEEYLFHEQLRGG